jgi:hypothetical protein
MTMNDGSKFGNPKFGCISSNQRPPQSLLQRLNSAVQYAIHFRIQHFYISALHELNLSADTYKLAENLKALQWLLKESIRADYERQKADILAKRQSKS